MIRERPILFSGPMVRAILDGSKTATRRPVKPQPVLDLDGPDFERIGKPETWKLGYHSGNTPYRWSRKLGCPDRTLCPYGIPGDRLWVRETFSYITLAENERFDRRRADGCPVRMLYRADSMWDGMEKGDFAFDWSPSIHMPRWASRILLEVCEVRVERLQDISAEDCRAEGTADWPWPICRDVFQEWWTQIHGRGSWDENPWLWVVCFRRLEP